MAPAFFPEDNIPYDDMWADLRIWLPLFLERKCFEGTFEFREDQATLARYQLKELAELPGDY